MKRFASLKVSSLLLMGLVWAGQTPRLAAQNLLLNGSFDAGNTGFSSDYSYSHGNLLNESTYDVIRIPSDVHPMGASFTDHTSGTGLMLAVNGSTSPNWVVWRESVSVAMNTTYEFSGWATSWCDGTDPDPSRFSISFNGSPIGSAFQLTGIIGQWQNFSVLWGSSTSASALIELRLETTGFAGNDPAFDDFQLTAVPEPSTLSLLALGTLALLGTRRIRRRS